MLRVTMPTEPKPTFIEIVDAAERIGWDSPSLSWDEALRRLLGMYELSPLTKSRLARCKRAFERGKKFANKDQPAIT
jgi:hypothetical protein